MTESESETETETVTVTVTVTQTESETESETRPSPRPSLRPSLRARPSRDRDWGEGGSSRRDLDDAGVLAGVQGRARAARDARPERARALDSGCDSPAMGGLAAFERRARNAKEEAIWLSLSSR